MSPEEFVARCAADFEFYATHCLKVMPKEGGELKPFVLNSAQRYIHQKLEEQKAKTGRVRALCLKGRQIGCSTLVQARIRWRLKHKGGLKAYVLTHEEAASQNLFAIYQRYHDNEPAEIRPHVGAANAKEMWFDALDSLYTVATAGNKGAGRSGTAQIFAGSECGFWPNAKSHFAGLGQVVADQDDTEIILESTANGRGNDFHQRWQRAEAGLSDYIAIFVPWFWQDEYRRPAEDAFKVDDDERFLMDSFKLDIEQIAWRRNKIATDFSGDVSLFHQEYPNTPAEAFVAADRDTLLLPAKVTAARKAGNEIVAYGPLVLGIDPSYSAKGDRFVICWRRGRVCSKFRSWRGIGAMEAAGRIAQIIDSDNPTMVFIERDATGAAIGDRLTELGYKHRISLVIPGGSPNDERKYLNKRAECWGGLRDWLHGDLVRIPDNDVIEGDLLAVGYKPDSHGRITIQSKEKIKEEHGRSPDYADALAVTFAEPVRIKEEDKLRPTGGFVAHDSVIGY